MLVCRTMHVRGLPVPAQSTRLECRPPAAGNRSALRSRGVARIRHVLMAAAALALAMFAASCAGRRPPQPLAPSRPAAGYDRLVDSPDSVDASGLRGRRIAIDPGHGGVFRGALGTHGLTEAEVNLDVSQRLAQRLTAAGAEVLLTHDTDRDYLTPADSALRADLAERVRIAAEFHPDLFVSVHHNADASGRHDVNETQTYYKLGDDGPSLDVAQDVHRSLVRNLGIAVNKVAPGNYYVLRNSVAPAILTESSYLTNPDVEAKLRLPEKRAIEAAALYMGLARYFARPVPVIAELTATSDSSGANASAPEVDARIAGEFDTAELRVDDVVVPVLRTRDRLAWTPATPLAQGAHRAALRVRLTGVGAAREAAVTFDVRRPPAALVLSSLPPQAPLAGGLLALRIAIEDTVGAAVPESLGVRVIVTAVETRASGSAHGRAAASARTRSGPRGASAAAAHDVGARTSHTGRSTAGSRVASRATRTHGGRARAGRNVALLDTLAWARDGVAWVYASIPARTSIDVTARLDTAAGAATSNAITASARIPSGASEWTGFVRRMPGDSALANAPGTREPAPTLAWINRDGFAALDRATPDGAPDAPQLPGYRAVAPPPGSARDAAPKFVAIAGGALHGRRIVIDPDGGGDQTGGAGPGGTRAANLNLEVARALGGLLSAAGAQVRLTRDGDVALSELERVQISEAFHADRFLRIGHRAEPARIGYYVGSAAGAAGAAHLARGCELMGTPPPPRAEDAQYPLQQTSCPGLYASLGRLDTGTGEAALLAPGALRREAWALYLGLAMEWSPAAAGFSPDSVFVRDLGGLPVPGAAVRLGGALVTESDAHGIARFARTDPGALEAVVRHGRLRVHRVLLDSDRGTVLTGPAEP